MSRPTLRLVLVGVFACWAAIGSSNLAGAQEVSADESEAAPETSVTATAASPSSSTATSAEPTAADATTAAPPIDGATYRVRLRDLEQRVDELKEQIRRSHTRLSLLSDTILSGAVGGARAEIEFTNDLSGAWRLVEAVFVLDGAVQYKKTDDSGTLAAQKKIPIFAGSIPTGDHTLQVLLKLRGHGYGVFSYLRGVEATVRHDHSFTVTDGKVLELRAVAWEQGGPTTPLEEQPDIRFTQTIRSMSDLPRTAPAEPAPAEPVVPPMTAPAAEGAAGVQIAPEEASAGASVGGGN